MKNASHILILLLSFTLCTPAFAQGGKGVPLEITADKTLEWHRNENVFIAQGNANARQGTSNISADTLTASYREGAGKGIDIWQVTAEGGVVLTSGENKAYGEHAVYNIDDGLATMTGDNLRLLSGAQTVTAKESFEYQTKEGKLIATGRAKMIKPKPQGGTDTLEADTITATLHNGTDGQREIETLEAEGGVIITTPEEIITGDYGIFHREANTAEITGNVIIQRGPNRLEGEKAQVDMNTNISRMFGSDSGNERIRGIFYPGTQKKPEQQPDEQ